MFRFGRHLAVAMLLVGTPASIVLPAVASAAVPGSTSAVNVDNGGLALRGYDPVAYFDGGTPTKGVETISATYNGVRYLFASEAHRKAFEAEPKRYLPEFGGFCAIGTSFGEKVDADPETGRVINGKLYVNYDQRAQALFNKDVPGTISRADQNWPTVKDKAFQK
ncbi:hypothetical protein AX777_17350 [Sphingobium yanoikuyae]|jgi:YHS domain-containing protein|uniref:YHS domain-containing protein n=1 Tax=Sphingobium yanoikuyae TaxID=13690 RepID=A0A177JWW3_SPHYA|nr:YHS domain-containing (seleno)protein [Sphingobium yanoikuyae]OAH45377.1 hypothetical protein AX777_17350 [Sphingobium yanoikuyae]